MPHHYFIPANTPAVIMIKEFWGFPEFNHYMLISGMRLVLGIIIRGFSGIYPDIPRNSGKGTRGKFSKASRVYWGPNSVKCWGISGRNSPKNFDFQGGDGDNDFGEFANSTADPSLIASDQDCSQAGIP